MPTTGALAGAVAPALPALPQLAPVAPTGFWTGIQYCMREIGGVMQPDVSRETVVRSIVATPTTVRLDGVDVGAGDEHSCTGLSFDAVVSRRIGDDPFFVIQEPPGTTCVSAGGQTLYIQHSGEGVLSGTFANFDVELTSDPWVGGPEMPPASPTRISCRFDLDPS
jgi:hypothetical protein